MGKDSGMRRRLSKTSLTRRLAWFRYHLRQFLRFSERAARQHGVTPLQHQLLLGIAGFSGRGWATISELAEFLQERHNAVVGLVQRAERRSLVRKEHSPRDQRVVRVHVTARGAGILHSLTRLHQKELERFQAGGLLISQLNPQTLVSPEGGPHGSR